MMVISVIILVISAIRRAFFKTDENQELVESESM